MKTTLLIVTLLTAGLLPPSASADGLPVVGVVAEGLEGQAVRYEALPVEGDTFVQRLRPRTEEVLGSRLLRGTFEIPVVAYDGSAAGLSADGKIFVLIAPRRRFPRERTAFAVLDAASLKLRKLIRLRGDYSFDALSPSGRWLYLIHYTSRHDRLQYEVVALDLKTGKLLADPIVDPREPGEKMNGDPLTRAASSDGRWAYTLYEGTEHPFVHALDTAAREARCIDLDWLHGDRDLRRLRFRLRDRGRELTVRQPGREPVAVVDTRTFEASRPSTAGVGSWPMTGLSLMAFLALAGAFVYVVRTRLRS